MGPQYGGQHLQQGRLFCNAAAPAKLSWLNPPEITNPPRALLLH